MSTTDSALRKRAKAHDVDAVRELVRRHVAEPGARKLWREPTGVRLRVADEYVGQVVDVELDRHRDGSNLEVLRARLVSSAVGGTSGAVVLAVVLRFPLAANLRDKLLELALVSSIRTAPVGPSTAATYPR